MYLVDDPDERLEFPPQACRGCGAGLGGQPVEEPAPLPKVGFLELAVEPKALASASGE
jgi:hypothetical protein